MTAALTVSPGSHGIKTPEGCVVNIRARISLAPSVAAGVSRPLALPWALDPAGMHTPPFPEPPEVQRLQVVIPWADSGFSSAQLPRGVLGARTQAGAQGPLPPLVTPHTMAPTPWTSRAPRTTAIAGSSHFSTTALSVLPFQTLSSLEPVPQP